MQLPQEVPLTAGWIVMRIVQVDGEDCQCVLHPPLVREPQWQAAFQHQRSPSIFVR